VECFKLIWERLVGVRERNVFLVLSPVSEMMPFRSDDGPSSPTPRVLTVGTEVC